MQFFALTVKTEGRADNQTDNIDNRATPDSKVYGANMGPTWDRQNSGRSHVGPMDLAIWRVR